jgi:hypothetical protein
MCSPWRVANFSNLRAADAGRVGGHTLSGRPEGGKRVAGFRATSSADGTMSSSRMITVS